MIQIQSLNKQYGKHAVLQGVDLEIPGGRVTSVVGPNGAGKTTLIKCLLGLTRPDSGRIAVDGHHLNGDWMYRSRIGYMPQQAHFPGNLTGREIISMIQDMRGHVESTSTSLIERLHLSGDLDKPFQALSGGTRQKISAVVAFLYRPDILILDEPTAGLDPVASSVLKDEILHQREAGRTVMLTSHIMTEVEELSDRIVLLLDGQVYYDGDIGQLKEDTGHTRLERAVASLLSRLESRPTTPSQTLLSTVVAA